MAKQDSIIKLNGTIGGVTFYRTKDGYLAKENHPVSKDKIMNDPAFQRTRENMSEFGRAGQGSKTLRTAFRSLLLGISDKRMTSRLTSELVRIVKTDRVNGRGQRTVVDGNLVQLEGFEFNEHAQLESTLFAPYTATINRATGDISVQVPSFIPVNMVEAPQGATHFIIGAAGSEVDLRNNVYNTQMQTTPFLPLDTTPTAAVNLVNTVTANSALPLFALVSIQFFQLVNNVYYPLKDGGYNALKLVKADI